MSQLSFFKKAMIAAVLTTAATAAYAVSVNARIRGTVTDPAGAVIPNAQVVATNQATGVKFTTTSQGNGAYIFQQLPVGTYTVSASAPGFKGFSATGIVLTIDQEYTEAVQLQVGGNSETVAVEADAVQVNTTDSQLNNVVNSAQMEELPLIGRNFSALELTLPGVALPDSRFTGSYSVNGSQSQQSSFLVNGADTNDFALNTQALSPNLDAVDQFNLVTGPLNAEYDRNSGGIVSATIKQGTNSFHGDVFEFYRDTFLNTNNFFQKHFDPLTGKITNKVTPYHQNIYGGTLGGPIVKDKLFFFGAYQGTRQRVPQTTQNNTIYSAGNLQGDFSADNGTGTRPVSATATTPAGTYGTFSGNVIPSTLSIPGCTAPGETFAQCAYDLKGLFPTQSFSTISTGLISTYIPPAGNSTSLIFNPVSTTTLDQYIGRVDFDFNPRNQFNVVGIYQKGATLNQLPFTGGTVPGFGDSSIQHIQQYTAEFVHQFSSTAVNDLAAHYTRFNFNSGAPQKTVAPSSVGFTGITPQDTSAQTVPNINVDGFFTLGGTTNGPQPRIDQVIQFDDNFSKTFGNHNLKIGYDGRRFNVSNLFDASNSGAFGFISTGTFSSGDPSLDFLLGNPSSFSQGTGSIIQADAFLNYFYAQDTWRVTNALTLNYGLGYSIDTPLRNHQYGGLAVSCFALGQTSKVFPNAPTNLLYPGDPGCSTSGQAKTRYSEFGPRFGFAWAPDLGIISGTPGKFAVRGGFGIYYNRTEEESALQTLGTPPFGFSSGGAADFGGQPSFANPYADINGGVTAPSSGAAGSPLPAASEANRFPYVPPTKGQNVDFAALEPIYNISGFDKSFRAPYSENFQVSVEREMPSHVVARVSYVGALGRHNQVTYEGNYTTQAGHDACAADPTCVANRRSQASLYPGHTIGNNPNLLAIGEVGSYASSNYNSLQVSLTKAPTHGLLFQLSYTYAHAMDDGSSFENTGFGENGARGYNQYDKSLNYGDSTYDIRHHLVFSPVYSTPILHGHSTFSPVNLALSGWQVSGILTLATGLPFDISYAGGSSNSLYCSSNYSYYACPDVPQQIAPLVKQNPRLRNSTNENSQYFLASSFAAEPIGTFGNVHRNPYHGPGTNNTNLIIAKNLNLSADGVRRLQLRMESDNVFNHTQFLTPIYSFSSKNFGQLNAAAPARLTQLAAKIYF